MAAPMQYLSYRWFRIASAAFLIGVFAACSAAPAANDPPLAAELPHSPGALAVAAGAPLQLPNDEAALLAGRRLYVAHCVTCHAAGGRGDELYRAETGQSIPDLTQHMVPGIHSDSQILSYVRDGISGTSMPGYGLLFSETELLQLVAYLRTFAQAQPIVGADPDALATEQARPPTPTAIPDVREALPALVFTRDGKLWRSNAGDRQARQVGDLEATDLAQYPAFGPAGQQLAFVSLQLPATSADQLISTLYVSTSAGDKRRILWQSNTQQMRHPSWSADGSAIYASIFSGRQNADGTYVQESALVQIDSSTGQLQILRDAARDLTVDRAGSRWAFVTMRPDGSTGGLLIADPPGGNEQVLVAEGMFEEIAAPRFSPDGTQIIFAARGEPLIAAPEGRSWRDWARAALRAPTAAAHGTPWDIWAVASSGGPLQRLTTLGEDEPHAVFSPDGSEIMIFGLSGLYRMDNDGARLRRIDPNGGYGGLDWASDGN